MDDRINRMRMEGWAGYCCDECGRHNVALWYKCGSWGSFQPKLPMLLCETCVRKEWHISDYDAVSPRVNFGRQAAIPSFSATGGGGFYAYNHAPDSLRKWWNDLAR